MTNPSTKPSHHVPKTPRHKLGITTWFLAVLLLPIGAYLAFLPFHRKAVLGHEMKNYCGGPVFFDQFPYSPDACIVTWQSALVRATANQLYEAGDFIAFRGVENISAPPAWRANLSQPFYRANNQLNDYRESGEARIGTIEIDSNKPNANVDWARLSSALKYLPDLQAIRIRTLQAPPGSDVQVFETLANLPRVARVDLYFEHGSLSDAQLAALARMPHLEELRLRTGKDGVTPAQFQMIAAHKPLKVLYIAVPKIRSADLLPIRDKDMKLTFRGQTPLLTSMDVHHFTTTKLSLSWTEL